MAINIMNKLQFFKYLFSAVFRLDLTETKEEADRRSGSREFKTEGIAMERACDAE